MLHETCSTLLNINLDDFKGYVEVFVLDKVLVKKKVVVKVYMSPNKNGYNAKQGVLRLYPLTNKFCILVRDTESVN